MRYGLSWAEEGQSVGILQQIRTKFGLGADASDAAALERALHDLRLRIEKNHEAAQRLEAEIPSAVIASIDAAATERRRLSNLHSEHAALVVAAQATERELAEAKAREKADELERRWRHAESLRNAMLERAAAVQSTIETLTIQLREIEDSARAFSTAVPSRPSGWTLADFTLEHFFAMAFRFVSGGKYGPRDVSLHDIARFDFDSIVKVVEKWGNEGLRERPDTTRETAPEPTTTEEVDQGAI